jgi:hypothetical protein
MASSRAMSEPGPSAACRNCDATLPEPAPPYCAQCGQETALRPPTVGEFLQQFGGAYLATEGALWRTLKRLAVPGALTEEYLAGRRRRYVLPLRLYLTVSLVVLLLARGLAGLPEHGGSSVESAHAPAATASAASRPREDVVIKTTAEGFECRGLPDWVCARLKDRFGLGPREAERELDRVAERFRGNLGAAMFVLLPGFALGLRALYANRGLRTTEHLVFALHVHTVWFLLLGLSLVGTGAVTTAAALAAPVYTLLAMRRIYRGRWGPLLARAAVLAVLYGALLLAAVAALALWALLA